MLAQFKEFAIKGNVVDMAVGIMIGAAFTSVVKGLVDEVLTPPLGLLLGNVDFSDKFLLLKEGTQPPPYLTLARAREVGAVVIGYGQFLNAVISFVTVALVLFFVVRWINNLRRPEAPAAPAAPTTKDCPFCKSPIHLEATRCPQCTSELEAKA